MPKKLKSENLSPEKIEEKVNERLQRDFVHYRQTLSFLGANVPIETLCLPKPIENLLIKQNYSRVCDLIGEDLGKIKGLGDARLRYLTSRLDEFLTMSI